MKKILLLCMAVWFYGGVNAQSAAFLEITPDARAAALGGAGTALSPDAWSVYWNVAKAVQASEQAALAYSYSPWMKDWKEKSRLNRLGGYYRISDKDAVVVGFRHFANGEIDLSDMSMMDLGVIHPKEYSLEAGYARMLMKGLSVGATVAWLRSDLGTMEGVEKADAVAFGLGVYYRTALCGEKAHLSAGVNLSDLGSRLAYGNGVKYDLPARVAAGAALEWTLAQHHTLQGTANAVWRFLPDDDRAVDGGVGIEYGVWGLGFVRAGYRWADLEKSAGGDYFTCGAGVKYKYVTADFAWWKTVEEGDMRDKTWTLSVGICF